MYQVLVSLVQVLSVCNSTNNSTNKSTVIHQHRSSIMTYQQLIQIHDDDNADESSSLLLTVADASPPSFAFGQDGVATTKKKTNVPMRLMIATTCFVLGTLAVIYYDGSDSTSSSNTVNLGAALLDDVYDPSSDFCFKDNENANNYCWYRRGYWPVGNWQWATCAGGHGCAQCGSKCTEVY